MIHAVMGSVSYLLIEFGDAPGEGHAHLRINGRQSARIYSPWFHLGDLLAGNNKVEVTLNSNNHATFPADSKPVKAVAEIEVLPENPQDKQDAEALCAHPDYLICFAVRG